MERVLSIARLDGRLDAYAVHPEWSHDLRRRSAISNAHSSASIEGNPLTDRQAQDVVRQHDAGGLRSPDVHEREIVQHVAYHRSLFEGARPRPDLTVEEVERAHVALLDGVLRDEQPPGLLRGPGLAKDVVFGRNEGTAHARVREELQALLDWYYGPGLLEPLPVRAAVWVHEFLTIHPFLDGNGRVARALAHRLLATEGLPNTLLIVLDAQFNERRDRYYSALDAPRKDGDLHGWVDFFLACLEAAYLDAVRHVERMTAIPGELSGCERAIVEWTLRTGERELQVGALAKRLDYEPITVSIALMRLAELGRVAHNGKRGRASRYFVRVPTTEPGAA